MPYINVASVNLGTGTNVDWSKGNSFYNVLSSGTAKTYTFSNNYNGATILVYIQNTTAANITITWPAGIVVNDNFSTLKPGKTNLYTFVQDHGTIYMAATLDMA